MMSPRRCFGVRGCKMTATQLGWPSHVSQQHTVHVGVTQANHAQAWDTLTGSAGAMPPKTRLSKQHPERLRLVTYDSTRQLHAPAD